MIIENRGVILKKDHSVHYMFLILLQACLCNTLLLEMGYGDRKMRYWDFFLSIAGVYCSRNSGLDWDAPVDKIWWLWFSVFDFLWTHNAALTLKIQLGVKWFPPATKDFSVSKIVTVLNWDNIKTRLFLSPEEIGEWGDLFAPARKVQQLGHISGIGVLICFRQDVNLCLHECSQRLPALSANCLRWWGSLCF